jgi:cobalt-zinc-cadmium efflux system membrane fusion protein
MKKRNLLVAGIVLVGGLTAFFAWPKLKSYLPTPSENEGQDVVVVDPATVRPYLEVLPEVVELNGIRTAEVTLPTKPRELELRGQLNFDPDTLVHVHGRFPGQIVELGSVDAVDAELSTEAMKTKRDLRHLDHVVAGQELAVLWSKELGEKKAELVNALIRLRTNRKNLSQLRQLDKEAIASARQVRETERQVEQDETAVEAARMTLRSWMFTSAEIDEVAAEADRLHREDARRNVRLENEWARVPITAPRDGTIVEKNVNQGDIVNTDTDLFKLVDLSKLQVVAHVYEEDMAELEKLPLPIHCRITISSMPEKEPREGKIEQLGDVIDPIEHMALVFGKIDNSNGDLLAGQFVKAIVEIEEKPGLAEIPTRALVEDDAGSVVLVRIDPREYRYVSRRVKVVRRNRDTVYVRSELTAQEKQDGFQELKPGEVVVSSGALQLKAALQQPLERGQAVGAQP